VLYVSLQAAETLVSLCGSPVVPVNNPLLLYMRLSL
jgi:hypothetical protein